MGAWFYTNPRIETALKQTSREHTRPRYVQRLAMFSFLFAPASGGSPPLPCRRANAPAPLLFFPLASQVCRPQERGRRCHWRQDGA